MLSLCTESGNGMEEEFEGVTVSNLAKLAAKLGKDKILQVCNFKNLWLYIYTVMCAASYLYGQTLYTYIVSQVW